MPSLVVDAMLSVARVWTLRCFSVLMLEIEAEVPLDDRDFHSRVR